MVCTGTRRDGEPCRDSAAQGSDRCRRHPHPGDAKGERAAEADRTLRREIARAIGRRGSKEALAKRRELRRARLAGEAPPAAPRKGKRGPAPYAEQIADAPPSPTKRKRHPGDTSANSAEPAAPKRKGKAKPRAAAEAFGDLRLGTHAGRLEARQTLVLLVASGQLEPREADTILSAIAGQAREKEVASARGRVSVALTPISTVEQAAAYRKARDAARERAQDGQT